MGDTMIISKLEPSQHKLGRWLVYLENGELFRIGEGDVLELSLYQGMEICDELHDKLEEAALVFKAKERALNWMALKPMSRMEVFRKLVSIQVSESQAEDICNWLENIGLINDESYAKTVADHYFRKGFGEHRVRAELAHRGVPREFWEDVLVERDEMDGILDRFVESKLRNKEASRENLKKVNDAIVRRGYSWQQASAAIRRYTDGLEDE